jgi:hypothetical protein
MEINRYQGHGRTLMVEFMCYRCKTTTIRPLEECLEELKECGFNYLSDLRPPKEWKDGGFHYPMFCPECKKSL